MLVHMTDVVITNRGEIKSQVGRSEKLKIKKLQTEIGVLRNFLKLLDNKNETRYIGGTGAI